MHRIVPFALFVAFGVGQLTAPSSDYPPAARADSGPHAASASPYGQPMYAEPEPSRDGQNARLDAIVIVSSLRYGILPGCPIVGGIEDGTVIGYCGDAIPALVARGGNAGDQWAPYHGPIGDIMAGRMACLDGQAGTGHDCQGDAIIRAHLVAGNRPVASHPQP